MPPRKKFFKYSKSTSPSRQVQQDDPQSSKDQSDFNFLIGALTNRVLDSGLMDNKFQKIFFLSRDEQRKNTNEQRQIIERKLNQCLKFPKKIQNQGLLDQWKNLLKNMDSLLKNQQNTNNVTSCRNLLYFNLLSLQQKM